jgi:hypothetical protein
VDGKQYVTVLGGRGVVVPPPAAPGAAAGAGAPTGTGIPAGAPDTGRGGAPAEPAPTVLPKILTFAIDGAAK